MYGIRGRYPRQHEEYIAQNYRTSGSSAEASWRKLAGHPEEAGDTARVRSTRSVSDREDDP